MFLKLGITKHCTRLISTSNQLIWASTQLSATPSTLFELLPKNILTENWHARELGGAESKSGLSFLKFGPQNPFLGKFGPKKSVISFAWKLTDMVSVGCWFLFQHYFSEFATLNPFLGKFGSKRSKLSILAANWHREYVEAADSYSVISFFEFSTQNLFLGKFGRKKSKLFVLPENWHMGYLEDADSYCDISFLNF